MPAAAVRVPRRGSRPSRTLPSVPGAALAALATPRGRGRGGTPGWLLGGRQQRRRQQRRRRRHGERGLRRGQGGRLLRPAALPGAATGGGAHREPGESAGPRGPGPAPPGPPPPRACERDRWKRPRAAAWGAARLGPERGAGTATSQHPGSAAPTPPLGRAPSTPGPGRGWPSRRGGERAGLPCWQWEELEAPPGQVAGTRRLQLGEFTWKGLSQARWCVCGGGGLAP